MTAPTATPCVPQDRADELAPYHCYACGEPWPNETVPNCTACGNATRHRRAAYPADFNGQAALAHAARQHIARWFDSNDPAHIEMATSLMHRLNTALRVAAEKAREAKATGARP